MREHLLGKFPLVKLLDKGCMHFQFQKCQATFPKGCDKRYYGHQDLRPYSLLVKQVTSRCFILICISLIIRKVDHHFLPIYIPFCVLPNQVLCPIFLLHFLSLSFCLINYSSYIKRNQSVSMKYITNTFFLSFFFTCFSVIFAIDGFLIFMLSKLLGFSFTASFWVRHA